MALWPARILRTARYRAAKGAFCLERPATSPKCHNSSLPEPSWVVTDTESSVGSFLLGSKPRKRWAFLRCLSSKMKRATLSSASTGLPLFHQARQKRRDSRRNVSTREGGPTIC